MHPVLFILLGIVLLILFSGGYTFFVACRKGKEINWLVKEEMEKTPYGLMHEYVVAADHWIREHTPQDAYITSRDGLRLHALWIPASRSKATVILAHGYRSTYLLDFALMLDVYHQLGFNILIPEQRSHGESEGKYITFGVKESADMLDWIAYHNEQLGQWPVLLCGMSMGASTVLFMADEPMPVNVCGMIADCGFTSPKEILKKVYRDLIRIPAGPSIWAAELFARLFGGFSLYGKDTRRTLAHSRLPVLMIHGMADDFVPYQMTSQGYDACTSEKQLLLVANATHGASYFYDPVGYSAAIMYFLKTHIKQLELE